MDLIRIAPSLGNLIPPYSKWLVLLEMKMDDRNKETCQNCGKVFLGYENFQHHFETIHLGRRPFSCDYCQKAFKTIELLANHINNVHNEFETFKCDFCEQTLTNNGGLQN